MMPQNGKLHCRCITLAPLLAEPITQKVGWNLSDVADVVAAPLFKNRDHEWLIKIVVQFVKGCQ